MENICEYLRRSVITDLFKLKTIQQCWPTWQHEINKKLKTINSINLINLGDHLSSIFFSTNNGDRTNTSVSQGGAAWEAIICWYLNLCLLETRTVVIKQRRAVPSPIKEALTVKYGSFPSNTESDLIAVTFPDKPDYTSTNIYDIQVRHPETDEIVRTKIGRNSRFNYNEVVDALTSRDFREFEVSVIQCKTNWNDNAQIPMLWDMIYSAGEFERHRITVGSTTYRIKDLEKFTYSFITVPTSDKNGDKITESSTCVKRVQNLTGGNYWGKPTKPSIASSVKEIFEKNFSSASNKGLTHTLNNALLKLNTDYNYFNL